MTKGERIRTIRNRTGKTLTGFADAIGVSKQTLYKYENDIITNVPSDKIERMAEVAEVSPAYIMGWSPEYVPNDVKPIGHLTADDVKLVSAYHNAPQSRQEAVRALLGLEDG